MRSRQHKNIRHLLNSESFLPASSASVPIAVQPVPKRTADSLIKTVCNECINGQQIISRRRQYIPEQPRKEERASEDKKQLSSWLEREVKHVQAEDRHKKQAKSRLSMDISQFLQSQQQQRQQQKQRKEVEQAKQRQQYTEELARLKEEQKEARKRERSLKSQLRNDIESQLREKSDQRSRSREESRSSLRASSVSMSVLISQDREKKRTTQTQYRLELDLQAKEKHLQEESVNRTKLEQETKRLRRQLQREKEAQREEQEATKQKALQAKSLMDQNRQRNELKKVRDYVIQAEAKRVREEEHQRVRQRNKQNIPQDSSRRVCIELREAMIAASNSRPAPKLKQDKSAQSVRWEGVRPPVPKICCEGCHEEKNVLAFGNFML